MTIRKMFGCGLVIVSLFGVLGELAAQNFRQSTINWHSTPVQTEAIGTNQKPPVLTGVSLQQEGMLVAMVGDDHVVNLFDRGTGKFDRQLIEHTDWVRTAKFSPDGTKIATGGNDRRLIVWDIAGTGRPSVIGEHPAAIVDVAWSPDGTKLATVGFENKLRIYSTETSQEINALSTSCEDLRTVAFSPDSGSVAVGGRNGKVEIWNVGTGQQTTAIQIHKRRIRCITFSNNNELLTCGDDSVVRVTDLTDTTNIRSLPRHGGKLFSLCTMQGGLLATGGSDNTIYIWDLSDLKQIGTLAGHNGTVTSLDFKDNVLASASYDTRVRLWTTEKMARLNDTRTLGR